MLSQPHPPEDASDAGKPVGIWIRVSTEDQAKGESPEHHELRARTYAENRGWTVAKVYDLSGVSGKTVAEHPKAKEMFADVKAGRIEALIFSKLARFARNTRELLDFMEYFRAHDADLVSLQEQLDTSTPVGRLAYTFIAGLAQWELEEISDRVRASVKVRAKLGKPLGGAAPFGYRWHDRKLVPDEAEVPVARRLFELFREHGRLKTVARLLNEAGHRTRGGKKFSDTTVRRLLSDPVFKGLRRANYTKSTSGNKRAWKLKPESEWIYTPVEAIIDEALWQECNQRLGARKVGRRPTKRVKHLFSGLALCACGSKMYTPSNTPKYVCYACRQKIALDVLETVFREELQGFFVSKEAIAEYLQQGDDVLAEKRQLLETLERELASVRSEMDKLYRLYLDGGISAAGFRERNDPLDQRAAALGAEIPRIQGEADFLAIRLLSSDELVSQGRDLYSHWQDLDFEEKRSIVETLVERVTVGKEDVTFTLNYAPTPPPPPPALKLVANGQRRFTDSSRRAG